MLIIGCVSKIKMISMGWAYRLNLKKCQRFMNQKKRLWVHLRFIIQHLAFWAIYGV